MSKHLNVLVIGATGQQGGAVAQAAPSAEAIGSAHSPADTQSSSARKLQELGIELAVGNSEESESVSSEPPRVRMPCMP